MVGRLIFAYRVFANGRHSLTRAFEYKLLGVVDSNLMTLNAFIKALAFDSACQRKQTNISK